MDLSSFDPNSFLDGTITEASIARPPLPATRDFIATIGEPKSRKWTSNKDPSNPKAGVAIDLPLEFLVASLPPDVQSKYAGPDGVITLEKIVITDGIMLDLVEVNGNPIIDMSPGKNAKLRKYREATNLNEPGQAFNPRMFQGRQVRVKIKHETFEGNVYDKADAVAKV